MIKIPKPKGGSGICPHCNEWRNNISYHAANCNIKDIGPHYTFYPENYDEDESDPLYILEFIQWKDKPLHWKLCKRNIILSRETFDKLKKRGKKSFMWYLLREGHPFTLSEGEITNPNAISLDNVEFLKFMVDALNEKVARKKIEDNE